MAKVNQRLWRAPGQRAKRKAWGFTVQADGKQKRCYKAEWTREDAEKALAALLLEVQPSKAKAPGLTLAQAAERYLATKARKRSLSGDTRILNHLKVAFGAETLLSEITASRISEYKARRLAPSRVGAGGTSVSLSAAAINRPLALLRHMLRLAHDEWEAVAQVPKIRLEKEPEGRIRWLEPDEEARLLAACAKSKTPHLTKIVTVALETGIRKGELRVLTWDRVDLSRGVIRLELTKSGRRREVPMRQAVYDVLSSLSAPREGRVWRSGDFRTAFENAVREAKLDNFHFHDCRHHFASWFVMRGGSLQALKEILGHATLAMTVRYAHLAPEHLRSEVVKTERRAQTTSVSTQDATQEVDQLVGVSQKSSS